MEDAFWFLIWAYGSKVVSFIQPEGEPVWGKRENSVFRMPSWRYLWDKQVKVSGKLLSIVVF